MNSKKVRRPVGRPVGYRMSEASKKKTSTSMTGRTLDEEHKENISTSMIGNKNRQKYSDVVIKSGLSIAYYNIYKRCYDKNDKSYKNYGGRNIVLCERWKDNVEKFCEDVIELIGKKPYKMASLDRIDNNNIYTPKNIRWADKTVQMLNRRIGNRFTFTEGIFFIKKKKQYVIIVTENNYCYCLARVKTERVANKIFDAYQEQKN